MLEEFNLVFKNDFAPEYLRNNKNSKTKNLRCFPNCSPEHAEKGFCGCSVVANLHLNDQSRHCIEELTVVGEFQPFSEEFDGLKDKISESSLRNLSDKPYNRYTIAHIEGISHTLTGSTAELVFSSKPWKYSWKGNRCRYPTYHSFVVSILAPNHGFGLKVLKQFFSPAFQISSVRRSPKAAEGIFDPIPQMFVPLFPNTNTHGHATVTEESGAASCISHDDSDIHEMTLNLAGLCSDCSEDENDKIPDESSKFQTPVSTPPSSPRTQCVLNSTPKSTRCAAAAIVTPDIAALKYDSIERVPPPSFMALKLKLERKRLYRADSPFTEECGRIVTHSVENTQPTLEDCSTLHVMSTLGSDAAADDNENDAAFIKLPFKLQRNVSSSEPSDQLLLSSTVRGRVQESLTAVRECTMSPEQRKIQHSRMIDKLFARSTGSSVG